MLKPEIKRLALFLILLYSFLIKTSYTAADIFAERIVSHNKFSAMTLDFFARNSFNNSAATNLFHSVGLEPGGFDLAALRIVPDNNDKFRYRLRAVKTNGDDSFCGSLQLQVLNRNFTQIYSGSLLNLSLTTINSDARDYIFFVSLDDQNSILKNKICEFNFDFKTFHDNPDEQGGIFAERLISNIISSGS
jgi:hypothetical protein